MAATDDNSSESRVVLGHVSGLFGVKGWVKLHSYTEPREAILDYGECQLNEAGGWRAATLVEGKKHGKGVIARFAGIDDRDLAQTLIDAQIAVTRDQLPEPEDGHYYWADLEGLEVTNKSGRTLGIVDHLLATGANDVLVVKGEQEILIPFVMGSVILDVDLDGRRIQVDWEWE